MPYVLAAYDISDDGKRAAAAARLTSLGFVRIQKSVYIARGGGSLAKDAWRAVAPLLDPGDRLLVMVVPGESLEKALVKGDKPWRPRRHLLV